ncbi:lipopolysaccharide biosynthesis protein [Blastococcus sp. SYSU DS1021]
MAVVLGSAFGQGVGLLASPILARLFEPADFGVLTVFTAMVAMLASVASGRLEAAIPLPTANRVATALAWAAIVTAFGFSALVAVAWLAVGDAAAHALRAESIASLWWLLSIGVFATAASQILTGWLVRLQHYKALGSRAFAHGVTTAGIQVATGALALRPVGLLFGVVAGQLAASGGLASRDGLLRQPRPSCADMWTAVKRYRRFPMTASWSALLNAAGLHVPLILLSVFYGQAVVGLVGLTVRVLAAPLALLGRSVAQVYQGDLTAKLRSKAGGLQVALRAAVVRLIFVSLIPTSAILAFGPDLFAFIFGAPWEESGRYAQLLAVGYAAQLAVSPISPTLLALERQGAQLGWDAGRLALTAGAPTLCAILGAPPTVAVAALSVGYLASYATLYILCSSSAKKHDAAIAQEGAMESRGSSRKRH